MASHGERRVKSVCATSSVAFQAGTRRKIFRGASVFVMRSEIVSHIMTDLPSSD
jgi:hypothetical protein